MNERKVRIKNAETGQWEKVWPKKNEAAASRKSPAENKAKGAAPENKGSR